MSELSISEVKVHLKKIGCKIKSQLGGGWAIYEPKGTRVLIDTLEDAQQYFFATTR